MNWANCSITHPIQRCRRRQSRSFERRSLTIQTTKRPISHWAKSPRSRAIPKTAYNEYSRALELQPNDPDALVEQGKILMTMNENDKAQDAFARAVQADPSNTVARYRLSMLYRRQGKTADADQQMLEYKKYKDMRSKLEKIFHDMRVGSLQKTADDTNEQR